MALKNFPPKPRKKRGLRKKPSARTIPTRTDPASANRLHAYRKAFQEWAEAAGYSIQTTNTRNRSLCRFIVWCSDRGIDQPQDITRQVLERYQRHLYLYRKQDGGPLSLSSQQSLLNPLKAFFQWLTRENHLLYNPASELTIPRQPRGLPKTLLSIAEVENLLNQVDVSEVTGVRDRAIIETLYSTGIRRMELTRLTLYNLDISSGTLMVRQGKGRRDRLIPIGQRACAWIEKYLAEVRPLLALRNDELTLFLTDYGEPFEKNRMGDLVRRYMRQAGIPAGACHALRHACATHMLEAGCDIRFIQALLGHSELSTTQIYTQVSIQKLKDIHTATHPAKMERNGGDSTSVAAHTPPAVRR